MSKVPLTVSIPGGAPTGTVFNGSTGFVVHRRELRRRRFLFASEAGTITAWNPTSRPGAVDAASSPTVRAPSTRASPSRTPPGPQLYATDFHDGASTSSTLFRAGPPTGRVQRPANLRRLRAVRGPGDDGGSSSPTPSRMPTPRTTSRGPATASSTSSTPSGDAPRPLRRAGPLNSPWGIARRRRASGPRSGALLVGNFGDGRIDAYDPVTGRSWARCATSTGGACDRRAVGAAVRQRRDRHVPDAAVHRRARRGGPRALRRAHGRVRAPRRLTTSRAPAAIPPRAPASVRRLPATFTPAHRGGAGPPLVCLHGFTDTWRTWELVLPALERQHDVLAPTLAGQRAGRRSRGADRRQALADAVERAMDDAGFATAHLVGNSLGGYVALQLAARGRARTVVAFAPAGGWAPGDESFRDTLSACSELARAAPRRTPTRSSRRWRGAAARRRDITVNYEHIPAELLAHQLRAAAACDGGAGADRARAARGLGARRRADRLPGADRVGHRGPAAAVAVGGRALPREWLPHADWVVLDGVGHCPQLDVPLETAQLILGFAAAYEPSAKSSTR